jgi:fatty-acyl-CoA synthase
MTVAGWFTAQAALRGGAIAVQENDRQLSYRALNARINQLASRLLTLGLTRGDRIAILSENRCEYLEVEIAAAKLGVITACQNWRQVGEELTYGIRLVEPKLIVVSERYAATLARIGHGVPHVLTLGDEYERMLACEAHAGEPRHFAQPEDGLVILYTSGTTGAPKGAVISHRAMVARTLIYALDRPRHVNGSFVAWMPMFHMGSCDSIFATLLRGGKVIIVDGFKAPDIAHLIGAEQLGHLHLNSAVIDRLIAQIKHDGIRPKGMHYVGVMADLVPPRVLAELTTLMGAPYSNTFGSTETGSAPASKGVIDIGVRPERFSKVQSSLCELRLVNENDCDVPDGEPGEALIRSPSLFSGYWRAPEINAGVFRDGWYHMGDVLRRNPDRTLDFIDRRTYLIKSGGENIYPAEIENVLLACPRIASASVVKRKDRTWGEVPVAFVVARDEQLTAEDVIALCRGKIAGYKLPKDVMFLAEEDVPRSTSGKIIRHELEARLVISQDSAVP